MSRIYVDRISPYQSASVQVDGLSIDTGSLTPLAEFGAYTASINTYTASNDSKVDNLISATSSYQPSGNYAVTDSGNTFNGNQVISGSVTIGDGGKLSNPITLGDNVQHDFFSLGNANVSGIPYGLATIGYQNYPAYGQYYEDAFVAEFADSAGFNYFTGLYVNGTQAQLLLKASGSATGHSIRMRANGSVVDTVVSGDTITLSGTTTHNGDLTVSGSFNTSGSFNFNNEGGTSTIAAGTLNLNANTTLGGDLTANGAFLNNVPEIPTFNSEADWFKWAPFTGSDGVIYQYAHQGLQNYSGVENSFAVEYANSSFDYWRSFYVGDTQVAAFIGTGGDYDYDFIKIKDNQDNTSTAQIKADSIEFTGSVSLSSVMTLAGQDPLPAGASGQLAVSASNLYFHNGTSWAQIN